MSSITAKPPTSNSKKPSRTSAPPKQMSSRLLTMKFMQKAAISSLSTSSPATAKPSSPSSTTSFKPTYPTKKDNPLTDYLAIQRAIKEEEAKREKALRKREEEMGEGRWELAFLSPDDVRRESVRVEMVGYADLVRSSSRIHNYNDEEERQDVYEEEEDDNDGEIRIDEDESDYSDADRGTRWVHTGRMTFGNFKSKNLNQGDADDGDGDGEKDGDGDGTRSSKPAQVELSKLKSISGGGGGGGGGGTKTKNNSNMECFACGEKGHAKVDCPNRGMKRQLSVRSNGRSKRGRR